MVPRPVVLTADGLPAFCSRYKREVAAVEGTWAESKELASRAKAGLGDVFTGLLEGRLSEAQGEEAVERAEALGQASKRAHRKAREGYAALSVFLAMSR